MNPKTPRLGLSSQAFSSTAQNRRILRDEDMPLRVKDIAAETNVCEKTVRRWITSRGLPSRKMGGLRVVRKCDLLAFLGTNLALQK